MKKIFKSLSIILFITLIAVSFSAVSHAAEEEAAPALEVLDLKIATSIVDREPIDTGESFTSDIEELYCYSKIKVNIESSTIFHSWYYNDEKVTQIELNVKKSPGFRTNSSKKIMSSQKGKWEVEVQDADGNVLKSITFTIE